MCRQRCALCKRTSSRSREKPTCLIKASARSRAWSRRDLCLSDWALLSFRHRLTRATRSATAPLLADTLSMRPASYLNASTARSTAIRRHSEEHSLLDAERIAAKHRSDSVNATSIDEQSLGRRQRLPALELPINGCSNSPTCAATAATKPTRSAPSRPHRTCRWSSFRVGMGQRNHPTVGRRLCSETGIAVKSICWRCATLKSIAGNPYGNCIKILGITILKRPTIGSWTPASDHGMVCWLESGPSGSAEPLRDRRPPVAAAVEMRATRQRSPSVSAGKAS
jgi:hypothetical protein